MSSSRGSAKFAPLADLLSKGVMDAADAALVSQGDRFLDIHTFRMFSRKITAQREMERHDALSKQERRNAWGNGYFLCIERKNEQILETDNDPPRKRLQTAKEIADRYITRTEG